MFAKSKDIENSIFLPLQFLTTLHWRVVGSFAPSKWTFTKTHLRMKYIRPCWAYLAGGHRYFGTSLAELMRTHSAHVLRAWRPMARFWWWPNKSILHWWPERGTERGCNGSGTQLRLSRKAMSPNRIWALNRGYLNEIVKQNSSFT